MQFGSGIGSNIFAANINFMKRILSLKMAANGILAILFLVTVFHLLVITGIIPIDIVWGGNLRGKQQLWLMESVSIAMNMVMMLFVLAYAGIIGMKPGTTTVKVGFWIMFVLFALNTLGNILAKKPMETFVFAPLTLLLSLFCFRIAADGSSNR
jgi:hypothetical protein